MAYWVIKWVHCCCCGCKHCCLDFTQVRVELSNIYRCSVNLYYLHSSNDSWWGICFWSSVCDAMFVTMWCCDIFVTLSCYRARHRIGSMHVWSWLNTSDHTIMQVSPLSNPGTLVFWDYLWYHSSQGSPLCTGFCRTIEDRHIVTVED